MTAVAETRSTPAVSVVIPLYEDEGTIGSVLAHLADQRDAPSFETIVVDDGSTDAGPNFAQAAGARVVRQRNAGPAAARNRGAALAAGEILFFLDADCLPPPDWLAVMTLAFEDPEVDAIMGTIRPLEHGLVPAFVQLEVEERYDRMRARGGSVDFIAAPNCGIRRAVFASVGGFDAGLRYAEDVEIAYRLRAGGYRIGFVDAAPVAHLHQASWRALMAAKFHRAIGRAEVLARYPGKAISDRWTPPALKVQVGMAGLFPILVLLSLELSPRFAPAALACLIVVPLAGHELLARAARALASEDGSTAGKPRLRHWILAVFYGTLFMIARAILIAAAMLSVARRRLADRLVKD